MPPRRGGPGYQAVAFVTLGSRLRGRTKKVAEVTSQRRPTPAEAGAQLGGDDWRGWRSVTATFPTGPRPSPGWG
ncbi:hypothetical protein SPHINGO391_350284 [Sphingomonas aurantiaca]|uniref:Uncharacterized protein n=1 Tax=Sphingomonas aurantiaca TaxID=185949 RepID=A0A5E7YAW7_9SPHN|nr:hypothetical protein SPHINGO391_350284 [Sphingomonas aurantiaca]